MPQKLHQAMADAKALSDLTSPEQFVLDNVIEGVHVDEGNHPLFNVLRNPIVMKRGDTVLDLGCGLGEWGIFAVALGAKHVGLLDVHEPAVEAACANALANGLNQDQFHSGAGDMFTPVPLAMTYDLIFFNPPQTGFSSNYRVDKYGGYDGADYFVRLAKEAGPFLNPGGRIAFTHIGFANPARINKAFESEGYTLQDIEEQTREFTKLEMETVCAGLFDHQVMLLKSGQNEFTLNQDGMSGSMWQRATLATKTCEGR